MKRVGKPFKRRLKDQRGHRGYPLIHGIGIGSMVVCLIIVRIGFAIEDKLAIHLECNEICLPEWSDKAWKVTFYHFGRLFEY